jgi:hypothetical protein
MIVLIVRQDIILIQITQITVHVLAALNAAKLAMEIYQINVYHATMIDFSFLMGLARLIVPI